MATACSGNSNTEIRFPAFWFSQNLVDIISSLDDVTQCTKATLRKGFYKGLVLVDSERRKFEVIGARKIRTVPFKWNFRNVFNLLSGNPQYQVGFSFRPNPAAMTLQEIKDLISDSFEKEKCHWEEATNFEELRERVSSATSMEQLFSAFKA
jgi:hypothetical protein